MSGPKVSQYELERRRREQLAKQIEEERRRREEEEKRQREEKRRQSLDAIGKLRDSLFGRRNEIRQLEGQAGYMSGFGNMDDVLGRIEDMVSDFNDALGPYSAATLEEALSYEEKLRQLDKRSSEEMKYFDGERKKWDRELDGALDKALGDIFAKEDDQDTDPSDDAPLGDEQVKEREKIKLIRKEEDKKIAEDAVKDLVSKAEAYSDDQSFAGELNRLAKVMKNLITLGDFHGAVSFFYQKEKDLLKLEKTYHEEKAQRLKLYEDALLSYEMTCEMAETEPEAAPEGLSLDETIKWLSEKRIETESSYLALIEKKEIRKGLSEVMEEMGYHVIAEKDTRRKSGKKIHEEVFSFGEGTAVNVTETDGQITMEIVGLDTSTRMPDETEEILLEEEMVTFCTAHKEIEEKLKEKGIVLKNRIQLNSPSKEYARILNITSYEQKEKNVSMIQDRKRDKKTSPAAAGSMTVN